LSPVEHALTGALAGTIAACAWPGPLRRRGRWIAWTTIGALAPDLDSVSLLFSHRVYFGSAWYSHRQFLHSILGCAFLAMLIPSMAAAIFARRLDRVTRAAFLRVASRALFAGGMVHLAGDLPTPPGPWGGMPVFFPLGVREGGWSRIGWYNAVLIYLLGTAALAAGALLLAYALAPDRARPWLRAGAAVVAVLALATTVWFGAVSRYENLPQWRAWQARFVPAIWIDALHHSGRFAAVFWQREVLRMP
jgi:membrane-bound metal-dependent hydrolase YbcI (DUF457 family)